MAVFQDLGFYQADFSMAEVMPWAYLATCDFLTNKCMEKNITQWPGCSATPLTFYCVPTDRLTLGTCRIYPTEKPLPTYFQYFTDSVSAELTVHGLLPVSWLPAMVLAIRTHRRHRLL
ncbi:Leishmanolysin (plasmid) [Leishmania braziliensis MHOM/BR/75/M2904]|uniref:Leishmanolysin n=1 Tax=Leishmania braziliensis MHOM/BR/75/M2904 TaxID=420245 RepID=A0A3P3YZQ7_LEIBR|nr:Leishmanolysin [Leishmania braziliensis MHOM/BR/75/M2904]